MIAPIGAGAMGRVLRAYDPKLQREVALKEVHASTLGTNGTRRMIAEARAMAKLSDRNVVAIYDVEELGDRVVLVMELVRGLTLRSWLSSESRPWADVVDRFVEAGRGLAAAHAAGLLHRDFKPDNVLVGDNGIVKVTDFGLAKPDPSFGQDDSSDDDGSRADSLTAAGAVMGTPRYMAPEQHSSPDLTWAADQYAFCVALWEALHGAPPFAGKSLRDLFRAKLEGPPSWRAPGVPRRIVRAIERGLAIRPHGRWPTMQALLEALQRPGGRRRGWVATVASLGILGFAGTTWQTWIAQQAERCSGAREQLEGVWDDAVRQEAEQAVLRVASSYAGTVWERAAAELDAHATAWTTMHTEACEATTIRGEQSTEVMDLRMACLHRAKVELAAVTDLLRDADADVARNLHRLVSGLSPLSRCADIEALQADVAPPSADDAEAVAVIRRQLAEARAAEDAGRYEAALALVEDAKTELESVDYGPIRTEVAVIEAMVLERTGDYPASEAASRRALETGVRWRQWREVARAATLLIAVVGERQSRLEEGLRYREIAVGAAAGDPELEASVEASVAIALDEAGRFAEAEAGQRRALARYREVFGDDHQRVAGARHNLAIALEAQGKYDEAEAEHRQAIAMSTEALGPNHPEVATRLSSLALLRVRQGRIKDAEAEFRNVLEIREHALGRDHPSVAGTRNAIAITLVNQGRYEEGEAEHRRALRLRTEALGPAHPDIAASHSNLSVVLRRRGKLEEAETEIRKALAMFDETVGSQHPDALIARSSLASLLSERGRTADAEQEYREALSLSQAALGPDHPRVAGLHADLGALLSDAGRSEEGLAESRLALSVRERALPDDHPDLALNRSNLASTLLDLGRVDEALPLAERAWERRRQDDIPPFERARTALVLADALWATGGTERRGRARRIVSEALDVMVAAGRGDDADELREFLDLHVID